MSLVVSLLSWVDKILNKKSPDAFTRKSWKECSAIDTSLMPIPTSDLVELEGWRKAERIAACNGQDPLQALTAYAQDALVYDAEGRMVPGKNYAEVPADEKVNKFKQAYKSGAPILLHRKLADIVVDAAVDLKRAKGWTTVVFDGLRSMDAGYVMYHNARDEWLKDKLLAAPGTSAHNRALAVDSMMFDASGREVPMGGHFDHSNMVTNHRNYRGIFTGEAEKDAQIQQNRLLREQAFMRAALKNGTIIAPLNEEFWDDRMPGSEKDLSRVIDSLSRCVGQQPPVERAQDYAAFAAQWKALNEGGALVKLFGDNAAAPPPAEAILYHEKLKPLFDRDLPEAWRQSVMDPALLPEPKIMQRNL